MTDFNTLIIEEEVSTQYNDLRGIIAIDQHTASELSNLCRSKKIDMEKYTLIGFGMTEFTTDGIGRKDSVNCNVYLIESNKYGNNFDEIESKLKSSAIVDVVKKTFKVSYTELYKYIKRYDFIALTRLSKHIKNINII